jgi:hypothetical protein
VDYCGSRWWELYDFVTKSNDEDFKKYFDYYFVRNSALYYYLFTLRYTMVDNRAKNSFWHYGKTGGIYEKDVEIKAEDGTILFKASKGEPIRKWDLNWAYDMDTSLGIDNTGSMVYRYGYEDYPEDLYNGKEVFRESDSTFFCRVRDCFAGELSSLYNSLDSSKNAWSADGLIEQFDKWQSQFPEELWRMDI